MTKNSLKKPQVTELIDRRWFIRLLEIFPGAMSWSFLIAPVILSLFRPELVAYFIIAFDLIWLIKSVRISYCLIYGYGRLHQSVSIDWQRRLEELDDIPAAIAQLKDEQVDEVAAFPRINSILHLSPKAWRKHWDYRLLVRRIDELETLLSHPTVILDRRQIINVAIVAAYNEGREIIEPSIQALVESMFPTMQMALVIAYEERGGAEIAKTAADLIKKYGKHFKFAEAVCHPDGIVCEFIGKGGNITFAGRVIAKKLLAEGIDPENVIVTTLDADNRAHKSYFSYLTHSYVTNPDRVYRSYQPVPMFFNNIWDVPAPMRIIATTSSFWMIIESMRPHRLRNFAAHSQSLKALIDTDFWSVTTIVEDGHQFWRTYFTYNGNHKVVPIFVPVYQDAVLAKSYIRTFKVQYIQLRRWAWGVSDFVYVVRNTIKNKAVPRDEALIQIFRLFEGHFSWATAPLILTFVAWLPLYLNPRFASDQLLAHELPVIASRVLFLAMIGISSTIIVSIVSLPPRPERYRRIKYVSMLLQWVLSPVISIMFSAFAAMDAQTRLMLGKYLEFKVTEKVKRK
jgi:hypothetical protein